MTEHQMSLEIEFLNEESRMYQNKYKVDAKGSAQVIAEMLRVIADELDPEEEQDLTFKPGTTWSHQPYVYTSGSTTLDKLLGVDKNSHMGDEDPKAESA